MLVIGFFRFFSSHFTCPHARIKSKHLAAIKEVDTNFYFFAFAFISSLIQKSKTYSSVSHVLLSDFEQGQ